jgi:hypothetical protein
MSDQGLGSVSLAYASSCRSAGLSLIIARMWPESDRPPRNRLRINDLTADSVATCGPARSSSPGNMVDVDRRGVRTRTASAAFSAADHLVKRNATCAFSTS